MRPSLLVALAAWLVVSPVLARTDWFPPKAAEEAAAQMIERFTQAGIELPNSDEDKLERARATIGKLVARVDAWGLKGIVENAPALAKIDLPEFDNRIISTIAVYGVCSMPLEADLVDTAEEKSVVVLGEMSVAIISAYLRYQYLARGGTETDLADALRSEEMNRLFYEIQSTEDTRNYIAMECGPTFQALWKS